MVNTTLVASVTGIVVSGVVGPQLTAWGTRRANRAQFDRDWAARQREELRLLLDEAAALLASGQTNLRRIREAEQSGDNVPETLQEWSRRVFPLGQRLRLRLSGDHEVVQAYEQVLAALITTAGDDSEAQIRQFEAARDAFLDASRRTLQQRIEDRPPS